MKEKDRHYNDRHSPDPNVYECPVCGSKMLRQSNCLQHMDRVHGIPYMRSKGQGKNNKINLPNATMPNETKPIVSYSLPSPETPPSLAPATPESVAPPQMAATPPQMAPTETATDTAGPSLGYCNWQYPTPVASERQFVSPNELSLSSSSEHLSDDDLFFFPEGGLTDMSNSSAQLNDDDWLLFSGQQIYTGQPGNIPNPGMAFPMNFPHPAATGVQFPVKSYEPLFDESHSTAGWDINTALRELFPPAELGEEFDNVF